MTPLDNYCQKVQENIIYPDPAQQKVLQSLQRVYYDLIKEAEKRQGWRAMLHQPVAVNGVYLWGGVGVGKTFLMDCFYQSLPFQQKLRMHFHPFMQKIHNELKVHQGKKDPLEIIAKEIAKKTWVLCFDEFFVSDITDAMLLSRLIKALVKNGVCLVATSNMAPDDLYKNGLQRLNFLPTIRLIHSHTEVIHIPSMQDYRLRHLQEAGVFYSPLTLEAEQSMERSFAVLTEGKMISTTPILIHDRLIVTRKHSEDIIWFDFAELCSVPRSQKDYLAISERYNTIFISDIPIIKPHEKDKICLFISLIDVLYDARVKLIISAALPVARLYNEGYMIMEYTRTHSRLLEMQSLDYFSNISDRLS